MTKLTKDELSILSIQVYELIQATRQIIETAHLDAHIRGTGLRARFETS